jgi:hypothetical protein
MLRGVVQVRRGKQEQPIPEALLWIFLPAINALRITGTVREQPGPHSPLIILTRENVLGENPRPQRSASCAESNHRSIRPATSRFHDFFREREMIGRLKKKSI